MKQVLILLLFIVAAALPQPSYANEQGFGVPRITAYPTVRPVSREGKVTGDSCRSDNDCIVGCTAGQPDDMKCLTPAEASNECVSPDKAPSSDYPCACLPDVMRCGFTFAKPKVVEEPAPVVTQPAPQKSHANSTKKSHVKKSSHKKTKPKTPKKKAAVKAAPAAAPTPITEPTHDSGQ